MMDDFVFHKQAAISATDRFIEIGTQSGYRGTSLDPDQPSHYFPNDASDADLGAGLRLALSNSRRIAKEEIKTFFNLEIVGAAYEKWVAELLERSGYGSRRAMFAHMKSCDAVLGDGYITIKPSNHEKLEAWSGDGIDKADYVVVVADASDAELGSGIRLALSRCIGK